MYHKSFNNSVILPALILMGLITHTTHAQILTRRDTPKSVPIPNIIPGIQDGDPTVRVEQPLGRIPLNDDVKDAYLQNTLLTILGKYPGIEKLNVDVSMGVVTVSGLVRTSDMVDRIGDFIKQIEGVKLVLNLLQSADNHQSSIHRLSIRINEMGNWFQRYWLSFLVAMGVILLAIFLNKSLARYGESIIAQEGPTPLSKTLMISLISRSIPLASSLMVIALMDLSDPFFSFFGVAGVLGITMGFAFQQIGENFIASIFLGMRRPFQVGDYIEIQGYRGFVNSLNARSTNILTLDSHLIRIPNSTIYKSIMVNQSASPCRREMVELKVTSYHTTIATAQHLMTSIMMKHPAVLTQPPPRVLIEELLPDGILLKAYYWVSTKRVDRWLLASQLRLAFKVAFMEASIPIDGSAGVSAVSLSFETAPNKLPEASIQTLLNPEIRSEPLLSTPDSTITTKSSDPDARAVSDFAMSSEALNDPVTEFINNQCVKVDGRETFFTSVYNVKEQIPNRGDFDKNSQ